MGMFCFQCEQTTKGTGCTVAGACGKDAGTAVLQDELLHLAKGIAKFARLARQAGATDRELDRFNVEALFSTGSNVNFDPARLQAMIVQGALLRDKAKRRYEWACGQAGIAPAAVNGVTKWMPAAELAELVRQGDEVSILRRSEALGEDVTALQETLTYGLKGVAAYAHHALMLGKEDDAVYAGIHEELDFLTAPSPTLEGLVAHCLRVGALNLKVMELLDAANTGTYGHPVPTKVRVTPVKGKAILVSGHDLGDLEAILEQTAGSGINVYTHGEMLPAHGYPKLKAHPHLAGNYGGAWMDQVGEFDRFPGAVLMTTNCIMKPRESYKGRIFTTGLVGWPGVTHVTGRDFRPVIAAALAAAGFAEDGEDQTIVVGFGRQAVLGVSDKVIAAVKRGAIKHFFLIGGCDGAKSGRNYYTELAKAVPADSVIMTLACGKYRFNNWRSLCRNWIDACHSIAKRWARPSLTPSGSSFTLTSSWSI